MSRLLPVVLLSCLLGLPAFTSETGAAGQTVDMLYLKDGSSYEGKRIGEKNGELVFEVVKGKTRIQMAFPLNDVERIEEKRQAAQAQDGAAANQPAKPQTAPTTQTPPRGQETPSQGKTEATGTTLPAVDIIVLNNGTRAVGKIVLRSEEEVVVRSADGKSLRIATAEIKSVLLASDIQREYMARKNSLPPKAGAENMQLAQWCLTVGLRDQAAYHTQKAAESGAPDVIEELLSENLRRGDIKTANDLLRKGLEAAPGRPAFVALQKRMATLADLDASLAAQRKVESELSGSILKKEEALKAARAEAASGQERFRRDVSVVCKACKGTGTVTVRGRKDRLTVTVSDLDTSTFQATCPTCRGGMCLQDSMEVTISWPKPVYGPRLQAMESDWLLATDHHKRVVAWVATAEAAWRAEREAMIAGKPATNLAAVPVAPVGGERASLTAALEKATTGPVLSEIAETALRTQQFDIAASCAQRGAAVVNPPVVLARLIANQAALEQFAARHKKTTDTVREAIANMSRKLQDLAVLKAMAAKPETFGQPVTGVCPNCNGKKGEKLKQAVNQYVVKDGKDILVRTSDFVPCARCNGTGQAVTRLAPCDAEALNKEIEKCEKEAAGLSAHAQQITAQFDVLQTLANQATRYLLSGEGTFPDADKSGAEFQKPDGRSP